MTPRTAARVANLAAKSAKPPAKRIKLMGADEEIELQDDRAGARSRNLSAILGQVRFSS